MLKFDSVFVPQTNLILHYPHNACSSVSNVTHLFVSFLMTNNKLIINCGITDKFLVVNFRS